MASFAVGVLERLEHEFSDGEVGTSDLAKAMVKTAAAHSLDLTGSVSAESLSSKCSTSSSRPSDQVDSISPTFPSTPNPKDLPCSRPGGVDPANNHDMSEEAAGSSRLVDAHGRRENRCS